MAIAPRTPRRVSRLLLVPTVGCLALLGLAGPASAASDRAERPEVSGTPADAASTTASGPAAPGLVRAIVQLKSPGDVTSMAAGQRRSGFKVKHIYTKVLDGYAADLTPQAITALRKDPRVEAVTPDAPTRISDTQPGPPWGLDRVDQRSSALDGAYSYGTTGSGVTVYVVDSGVRFDHTQFGGRATSGFDFVDGDWDASDCAGHGTHVAGTVAGSTYGVAKQAKIVSLRVFDCQGSGYFSDTIAAFDWAVSHKQGPAVINYSGGGGAYAPVDEAVARATAAGISVAVSAGNSTADACGVSPARAATAITVGATEQGDARASYSNYGWCVDLFAPGSGVLSSWLSSPTASAYLSGTSMASPHVAGAIARFLQTSPTASPQAVSTYLQSTATPGVVFNSGSYYDGLLYVQGSTALGAPTAFTISKNDASRAGTITWLPPASTGGATITGYRVARTGWGAQGPWSAVLPATSRNLTFTNLVSGGTYTLSVQAVTAAGPGPAASGIVTIVAPK